MSPVLRRLLRPLPLLVVGASLLMSVLLVGETVQLVQRTLEWGSPLREVVLVALGLTGIGGAWLMGLECRRYLRLRRVEKLKVHLAGHGPASPELIELVQRWMLDVGRAHGAELDEPLAATRAALAGAQHVGAIRTGLTVHLLPALDARVEKEIRRSAMRLGVVSTVVSLALLEGMMTLWFTVRLVRRVAELHGARPGLVGTAHLLREVSVAALGADLSQHAADALSAKVGSLAAAAGQGLVTATLVVRVGLWSQKVCRPVEIQRGSVGGFVARGAARELSHCVRGGVQRAVKALRS